MSFSGSRVSCSWTPSRRRRSRSCPSPHERPKSSMRPAVGGVRPSIISSVVVLPAPLGPSRPKQMPRRHLEVDAVDGLDVAVVLDEARAAESGSGVRCRGGGGGGGGHGGGFSHQAGGCGGGRRFVTIRPAGGGRIRGPPPRHRRAYIANWEQEGAPPPPGAASVADPQQPLSAFRRCRSGGPRIRRVPAYISGCRVTGLQARSLPW